MNCPICDKTIAPPKVYCSENCKRLAFNARQKERRAARANGEKPPIIPGGNPLGRTKPKTVGEVALPAWLSEIEIPVWLGWEK